MKVTIGIPVYNGEKYLARAIESILSQTYEDFELIISNNNSQDQTQKICEIYRRIDDRVTLINQTINLGAVENFEFLLKISNAEYFTWAAHDDLWDREYLEIALRKLKKEYQYFSPNWWVGDISRQEGSNLKTHPMKFIESPNSSYRFLKTLNMHHAKHKCNLVYSIFRNDFIRDIIKTQSIENDGIMSAIISLKGRGVTSDKVLFYKNFPMFRQTRSFYERIKKFISFFRPTQFNSKEFLELKNISRNKLAEHKFLCEYQKEIEEIYKNYNEIATTKWISLKLNRNLGKNHKS